MKRPGKFQFRTGKNFIRILALFSVLLLAGSCGNSGKTGNTETAVIDTIDCWVDSSLLVLAKEEVKSFENINKFPRFNLQANNEADILKALRDNKVNLAILHRTLDSAELNYFYQKEQFRPKQYEFAYDAYVFVTSESTSKDSVYTLDYNQVSDYLKSRIKSRLIICVENPKAQSLQFLKRHFKLSDHDLNNLYSHGNLSKMMDYLRSTPGSYGLIPFSLIADIESEKTVQFLKGLKVVSLRLNEKQKGLKITVEPSQSTIATKDYPLISPVVLVNCNLDKKSGINFVNYIFKTKSQRLIQQFGLCPAVFPGREILIHQ